ncbi:MAG: RpiB/LacA/LacB family sugar-phosphate isomerase [bacterium]
MNIHIASDHAGFKLKERIRAWLESSGYVVVDHGAYKLIPDDDYPIYARKLAKAVAKEKGRGILLCGSGVGMAIAANRIKGVRAVEGMSVKQVSLSRQDNDSNVLVFGAWSLTKKETERLVEVWLKTKFSKAGRHFRRIRQLDKL